MSESQVVAEPSPYPPDPASWRWDAAFALACATTFVGLLLIGTGRLVGLETWSVAAAIDGWSPDALLRTGADPWLPGANPLGRAMVEAIGTSTSWPYLAVLLLWQVAAAAALYVYARPRTGRVIAFGIGLVFLMLAWDGDDLLTAGGLGWSGSAALGAWAMVIVLGPSPIRHAWLATILLLGAVAFSAAGLAFVIAAIVVLLPRARRRYLWVVLPALLAVAVWVIAYGVDGGAGLTASGDTLDLVRVGIAGAVGRVSGLGPEIGLVLAVLLGLATMNTMLLSDSMRLGLIAGFVGLATQYLLVAMAASRPGAEAAWTSPVLLAAAVFIFIALASWLAHRPLDVPGQRLRLVAVVLILVTVAIVGTMGVGLPGA